MDEARKLRVFLCHASQDKGVVRGLYERLVRESWIDPWLDAKKLHPGANWVLEIRKAVEESDLVIICFSRNSVNKEGFVQKEMRMVLDLAERKPEETIYIIPLCLDDCDVPYRFRNWQFVKYYPKRQRSKTVERLKLSFAKKARALGIVVQRENRTTHEHLPVSPHAVPEKAKLIWRHGEYSGQRININQSVTIGRSSSNNISLTDRTISRWHAKIVQRKGRYYIADLESSTGTFLNGYRLQSNSPFLLQNGNIVRLGVYQEFEFRCYEHV